MKLFLHIKPNKKWLIVSVLIVSACAASASDEIILPGIEAPGEEIQAAASPGRTHPPGIDQVTITPKPVIPPIVKVMPDLLPDEPPPVGAENQFSTDFSRHTIPYSEVLSGGPPKDGIPAIDDPTFISVAEADGYLEDLEPVVFFQLGEETRAYPLQILTWHEIVNDVVEEDINLP